MSPTAGQLITETLTYDGGRQVTAYVPRAPSQAIIFAGDGQLTASWGRVLEAADLPPTMIIGGHRPEDETLRLHEYSPGKSTAAFAFDPERFAAHEKFFVEEVRRWARARFDVALPAARTAVFGVSASAELALAMGLRHPDIYGAVSCASPGAGYRPPAVMPSLLPRAYLVAGKQEPFFLKSAPGGRTHNAMRVVAGAAGVSNTVTPLSGTVQSPCDGSTVTFSGNLHSTMEWTNSRDGGTHAVVHVNAQNLTGIGSDGTQYQLPQNSAQETNVAIGTGQETTSVANLRVVSQGAAPNFEMLITLHLTVSASGQLNVQSDVEAGQCPG